MKQAIVVVPLFLLLLTILYLFIPVSPEKISHESLISPDAQIVLTQYDLKDRVAEFSASSLGLAIADLRYDIVGKELGMTDEEIDRFQQLREEIKNTYQNPLVQMLIGREISVALFPFVQEESGEFVKQLSDHLLLVSRPRQNTRMMDVAAWAISSDERITTVHYGVHAITRFELEDNRRLSVARVKDLIVMSLNERILRNSLDLYDGDQQGLRGNEEYRSKIDQFEGASFIGYVNFAGLPDLINSAILRTASADAQVRLLDNDQMEAYSSAIFGAWRAEDTIMDKAVISIKPELLDDHSRSVFSTQGALPQSHTRIAPDSIVYHWSNQFNPETLMTMIGVDSSGSGTSSELPLLGDLEQITGLTPPQLFNLFDNELTIAVRGINENQLVPLPRFLLSVKSGEMETLKEAVNKLIDHYSIPVRRKTIEKAEIISWGGIIGISSVLPTLSFTDESVIISSSREQIRKYIDPQRGQSLVDNPSFNKMSATLLKPSNSITFFDFARTAEMLQEMVSWGGTMLALKDRELARKSKVLIDDLVNPLLEGLAMYSIIGSRKYHDGNTIVFESFTRLDNGTQ